MLDRLDALAQQVRRVVRVDGDTLSADHGPSIDPLVDKVDRGRRLGHAGGEHVFDRMRAGEIWERR